MATQETNAGEIICILDAFDECVNQERQDLAKILREFYDPKGNAKRSVNLKFLITSRPYDIIRRDLMRAFDIQECPIIHLKGDGDAEVEEITGEISLYIKDRVSRVRDNLGLTRKEEEILLQGLGAIHNQTYLWVFLTLEWIETEINNKINEVAIRKVISTLPRTVDEAYDKILSKSTDVEETKKLLHIVVAAERPLTLAEMELALVIRPHHQSYEDLALRPSDRVSKYIRDLCGLFITITDEKIYLLHQTAKEFLVPNNNANSQEYNPAQAEDVLPKGRSSGLTWKSSLIPSESHRILCRICIWRLLFTQFEDQALLTTGDVTEFLCDNLFFEYSAKNWAAHFRASNITGNEILKQLQRLCKVTFRRCPTWFTIYWTDIHPDFPLAFTTLMIASYFGIEMIVSLQIESEDVKIDSADGSYHRTALSFASENGFDSVVRLLIKGPKFYGKKALKKAIRLTYTKGADVNAIDKYNRTALFYAAWNGHMPIVKRLLKARARVDMVDTIGGTPISYALCYGQQDVATELMRGAQPDSVDEIRRKLLLSALKHGHDPVVERLLNSGADPRVADDEDVSLIAWATERGKTNIVKLLIERGAGINKGDRDGKTPLMLYIDQGETNIVELLIKKGADTNKGDRDGKTPLLLAAEKGNKDIVELLIEKGADTNEGDFNSTTPLMLAITERRIDVIRLLMDKGADVNKSDWGADVNKGDKYGATPLVFAIHAGSSHLVEMLLKGGARVDYTFTEDPLPSESVAINWHKTPLLYAIDQSRDKIVELLLRFGANPTFAGGCSFTPLGAAKIKRKNLNAELKLWKDVRKRLEDVISGQSDLINSRFIWPIERNLARSNAIVQMLEDAIRVR
ncbi:hypothetical protein A0O28_0093600 [Trichoderma guizhouense]|uniref:Uncharacterized protein n=1 Tax=Trichoderma guizhouense TaxID=1491466 RepID=A0A1T3CXI2_9HYPO|nr:hypothetical protein A0O28_0093600 [Trichoderma guizhouense]